MRGVSFSPYRSTLSPHRRHLLRYFSTSEVSAYVDYRRRRSAAFIGFRTFRPGPRDSLLGSVEERELSKRLGDLQAAAVNRERLRRGVTPAGPPLLRLMLRVWPPWLLISFVKREVVSALFYFPGGGVFRGGWHPGAEPGPFGGIHLANPERRAYAPSA